MILAVMSMSSVFVSVILLLYFSFFEPAWLNYPESPFPVLNAPVKAGEAVSLNVKRCSKEPRRRVYELSRTLRCPNKEWLFPATVVSIDPGCTESISTNNIVPEDAEGICHIDGAAEVQGVIRTILVEWASQPFEVVR